MLVMDIGNTHTRLAGFSGDRIHGRAKLLTRGMGLDAVAEALAGVAAPGRGEVLWIASVAPASNALAAGAAEKCGIPYRFISPARDDIVPHRLETPETTGVDRLLSAMAAGILLFPGAAGYIVVQCGSAVTVDWVDAGGFFRGGFIMPGPMMWLSGLAGAAQLPDLSAAGVDWDDDSPGASSRAAMLHGLAAGLPAVVAAGIARLRREADLGPGADKAPVALTGGWAPAVRARLGVDSALDEDILLHGIRLFAERVGGVGRDRRRE